MPFPLVALAAIAGVAAAAAAVGVGRVAASWELIGHAGGGTVGKSADEVVGMGGWSGGNWTGPPDMLDQGVLAGDFLRRSKSGGKLDTIRREMEEDRRGDEGDSA